MMKSLFLDVVIFIGEFPEKNPFFDMKKIFPEKSIFEFLRQNYKWYKNVVAAIKNKVTFPGNKSLRWISWDNKLTIVEKSLHVKKSSRHTANDIFVG